MGGRVGGGSLGFDILAFPSFQDVGRRLVNHLDLPLLPQLLGILSTTTNLITYLLDAVALYHELSDNLRIVLEWWILLSHGSGTDVYIVDCIFRRWLCRKESVSDFNTLRGRKSSCGDRAVEIELTDRFPKVN